ncbi:glycerate kinase [Alkalilimnicola sp. S0819]|uniref:glycerate kinase type-2 family protein n=1 Tax=Alkalilimnicola sp. S0819 TaxID=2613922 RepID=UPI001261C890|nr:DUF4147 domain-containing protein [Alkalilimnicola sp. S0819]KAB7619732.1 DUF4147 domain-containing protein [Alkalilimnicola sp. S0819]MPQ17495.1 DUF4147 domain-containing protein [Alkalilimnicola sp. S0819]
MSPAARRLIALHGAALAAVGGRNATARALREQPLGGEGPLYLLAVGKAAAAMSLGALEALPEEPAAGLVITREGYTEAALADWPQLRQLESAHPLPDGRSLRAGEAMVQFLAHAPAEARFLVLVSGGASALAELPAPGVGAADLAALNRWLLGSGRDIHAMNRIRRACSRIKGGRLAAWLEGRPTRALLISDVQGDAPAAIGSGLLVRADDDPLIEDELPGHLRHLPHDIPPPPAPKAFAGIELRIIATNAHARAAAAAAARAQGLPVQAHEEFLSGDAAELGRRLVDSLRGAPPGVHIWGGEPTVALLARPGRGGRMQQLALSAALALEDAPGITLLAAGTDGADGPGEAAGAWVDGHTAARCRGAGQDPEKALRAQDAGTALAAAEALLYTGPTGTNVMDLVIALVE